VDVPSSLATTVLDGDKLKPDLAKAGVKLQRQVEPSLGFFFFNLDDPVVGGYTPEKVALRRAIVMAQDRKERIRILRNGQAELATQMIPPPVPGYSPTLAMKDPYDPAAARALLDRFGYKDRDGDGFRESPDGKPIVLIKGAVPTASERAANELWKKNLEVIGLRTEFFVEKWPELNKRSEAGQLMIWDLAWIAGTPDADNFYSPLYSRNIGLSNDARLRSPDYDKAYEAMRALPEGPERAAQYRKMNEIITAYAPWILDTYTIQNQLVQPWVKGMKLHPFLRDRYMYFDVAR
jgi:oligopeptide transport system substrate-binding protein